MTGVALPDPLPAGPDLRPYTEVVAGVLVAPDGHFLMTSRPPGKVYAGYWEFPGGKVEPGETAREALDRELEEELGIRPTRADAWLVRRFSYAHARVRIRFFRVTRWDGTLQAREGQQIAWQVPGAIAAQPMLPANSPVLRALSLPALLGLTAGGLVGEAAALQALDRALHAGLRLVQVREKDFSPARLRQFVVQVLALARPHGARVMVNGDPDLALACGADGVHLDARRLRALAQAGTGRPQGLALCAASCHDAHELDLATQLGCDFAVCGPVLPTATHPGHPGLGWEAAGRLLEGRELPVFAIGGLAPADLVTARDQGFVGIAAIRSLMLPA